MSIFLSGCQDQQVENGFKPHVQGIDRDGKAQICLNNPNEVCQEIISIEDAAFAQSCVEEGGKVHRCGCNEYLCEQNKNVGLDINGEKTSCDPMPADVACTMEFTDGDQYRSECKESGGKPIQCGCHEYLCQYTEMLENEKVPDEKIEYLGTNQDGIIRSCVPDQNMGCPTVMNQNNTYAFNCKEDGFDVAWCSCNEVLCLDQE
jgi:hypothetical protein